MEWKAKVSLELNDMGDAPGGADRPLPVSTRPSPRSSLLDEQEP